MNWKKGLIIGAFSTSLVLAGCGSSDSEEGNQDNQSGGETQEKTEDNSSETTDNSNANELKKDKAESILSEFERRLVDIRTTDEGKVVKFDSKDELIEHLSELSTEEIATMLVNDLFEERDNGLYIIPKDYPPFLLPTKTYTLEKQSEGKYQLIQKNNTEIHGEYKLTVTLEYKEGNYIISDYQVTAQGA